MAVRGRHVRVRSRKPRHRASARHSTFLRRGASNRADGAILHIVTPHYTSRDSWIDPTHVKHFSLFLTDQIVDGSLLPGLRFELVRRHLSFGSLAKTFPQRSWAKVFGLQSYERFCAWRWPARNITIDLKIVKPGGTRPR